MVGNDRDEHGCIGSAGYSRNEEAQECQRPREQETASTETKTIQEIEALLNE
ncbi:MAG: hypothetical protein LBP53_03455 [Candidatus Peribacteria bacterium]|nr:hypothetical protein [Candidatus Peribacteria bacterium]